MVESKYMTYHTCDGRQNREGEVDCRYDIPSVGRFRVCEC